MRFSTFYRPLVPLLHYDYFNKSTNISYNTINKFFTKFPNISHTAINKFFTKFPYIFTVLPHFFEPLYVRNFVFAFVSFFSFFFFRFSTKNVCTDGTDFVAK